MDLADAQWEILQPVFVESRRPDGRGRPWRDAREVLNGVLWILRTGAQWHDLPDRYPPYQTCHRRFQQFRRQELEGVAYRTNYDLKQHQEASGKPLDYFDEETKERFIPHVVEPSAGVDRTVLALLCNAYDEETVTDEKGKSETRIVMRFHPRMAPIKVGVFPLLKNNEQLVAKARQIQAALRPHLNVFYDETGAIGRRYRRQDEAGTPFGITVDFETLGEKDPALLDTVTLRDRDSMKQERVKVSDLIQLLMARIA